MSRFAVLAVMALPLMPLEAATLEDAPIAARAASSQTGMFAGARLRVALGRTTVKRPKLDAGLSLAPIRSGQTAGGRMVTRFGEGLSFGFTSDQRTPRLALFGQDLARPRLGAAARDEDGEKKGGVGPAVYIVGGLLLAGGVAALVVNDALNDASE